MSRPAHLLLYGTLRHGEPNHVALGLVRALRLVSRIEIAGTLYDIGRYPGLVLDGRRRVVADLFEIRDESVIARLDAHEDYDPRAPTRSPFIRREMTLVGASASAWIYAFNRPVAGRPVIASGDWVTHRRRRALTRNP